MTVRELSGVRLLSPWVLYFYPIPKLANYSDVQRNLTTKRTAKDQQLNGIDRERIVAIIRMVGTRRSSDCLAHLYQHASGKYGAITCGSVGGQEATFSEVNMQQPMLIYDDGRHQQLYYALLPSDFE